jgi:predicted metal-dependent HD superfamily phosphohydrolase
MYKQLKDRWLHLNEFENGFLSDELFKIVCTKYSEKHRYYHTLDHIKSCLSIFDEISYDIKDAQIFEIALWLHDVIYNPKETNNEEQSTLFASELLSDAGFDGAYIEAVNVLIMATKHPSIPLTIEEKYIVDIDLAILGTTGDIYDSYSDKIKKEYCHIPLYLYKRGRKKVLQSFLKQKSIYKTEYFVSKYELHARANLEREMSHL